MTDLFRHSALKVPYERALSEVRSLQKQVEKDVAMTVQLSKDLADRVQKKQRTNSNGGNQGSINWEKVLENLVKCETKLGRTQTSIKEGELKLEKLMEKAKVRARFVNNPETQKRTSMYIVDHLAKCGYTAAARLLAASRKCEDLVDIDIYEELQRLAAEVKQGNTSRAVKWCAERRSKLRKINSSLEFELHRVEFYQLVCSGKVQKAVQYAKKNLKPFSKDHFEQLKRTMVELVMPSINSQATKESYTATDSADSSLKRKRNASPSTVDNKAFLNKEIYNTVAKLFMEHSEEMYGLTRQSYLQTQVQIGLATLKTNQCSPQGIEHPGKTCPCCTTVMSAIAEQLPLSRHGNSQLVCRISGALMDEHNPPMAMPNGQVYAEKALQAMVKRDGIITCPVTREKCTEDDLTKVFVL